ncbi:PAS domain-containing sensor histidine kinase [Achromobacter insolitus]|uniref:PAS domain-containing sensor histidine kinase n=2 Tax=Achromobacter insolitus TaxID=217204 RepID=UPI000F815F5A|nr:ATP-binding protein [Achromobacter insolitus]
MGGSGQQAGSLSENPKSMSTYMEAFLSGIALLLFAAILVLLHVARGVRAEARRLRADVQEARASHKMQARLLDATPTLIAALDGMNRYLSVNQAFEEMVGLDRSRLIGAKAGSLQGVAGSLGAQLEAFAAQCVVADQAITEVIEVRAANGRAIEGMLIVQPFHGDDGTPRGALVALVDVSARLAAEREAREIKDTVEDLTQTLPMAFFRIREEPGGHRWVPYLVGQTEKFLRQSSREILERSSGGNLPSVLEAHWPAAHAAADASRDSGGPIQIDLETHRANDDGWVRIGTALPRRLPDGSVLWNGYLMDVTQEHRDAEALSRAKAEADANAQAKSRFLAAMSHEIRTPLATTLGALELLRDTPMDDYQRQQVDLADSASRLLIEILGDILDFSRLEDGPVPVESIPYSVRDVLDQVTHIFSAKAREKGLTLDVCVAPEVAAQYQGDPVRVKQILLNLIGNAIKFTVSGGINVTVKAAPNAPAAGASVQTILVSVSDTGIGISAEAQSRLFRPFSQADASTVRQYGGSGLGLAICSRLSRLMGGSIQVQSTEGVGSRFDVTLPLHVLRLTPPDSILTGKRIRIDVHRAADDAALQAYAQTLGMRPVEPPSPSDLHIVELPQPGPAPLPATLYFAPDGYSPENLPPGTPPALVVAGGPVRFGELLQACLGALQTEHPVTKPSVPLRENGADPETRRILIVEDHLPYQIVIRNMVDKLGWPADVVADGRQALNQLERVQYALMLTDCHMPDMDGFELTRRVRDHEDARIRALPVVGLSADVQSEYVERLRQAGLNDFLVKPVNLSTLRECIGRWTNESR